jgi:hypothetical protein
MAVKKDGVTETPRRLEGVAASVGRRQLELLTQTRQRLFQQIEDVNQAWLDSVKRTKESEAEFTRRLTECDDAAKATELCTEWVTSRAAAFLAESQRFSGLWLDFYSSGLKSALAAAVPNSVAPQRGKEGQGPDRT